MASLLCKFTDSGSGDAVYVNPAQVRLARSAPGGTVLIFDHDQSLHVIEKVEVVVRALEEENLVLA